MIELHRLTHPEHPFFLNPDKIISIEANPAGFCTEKVDALREHGVNRVSLGVQSFSKPLLETLERDHDAQQIERTVEELRGRIDNFGFDLIFGVPGQSLEDWHESLGRAVGLGPQHVSTYGLTYEKGTSFWTRREQRQLRPVDESVEAEMYSTAMSWLPEHGFPQYELSNYARAGYESRHNAVYWQGLPYFGFGPGAAAYVNGTRPTNHRSVTNWLKRVLGGESGIGVSETLSPASRCTSMGGAAVVTGRAVVSERAMYEPGTQRLALMYWNAPPTRRSGPRQYRAGGRRLKVC